MIETPYHRRVLKRVQNATGLPCDIFNKNEVYAQEGERSVRIGFVYEVAFMTKETVCFELEAETTAQENYDAEFGEE